MKSMNYTVLDIHKYIIQGTYAFNNTAKQKHLHYRHSYLFFNMGGQFFTTVFLVNNVNLTLFTMLYTSPLYDPRT